MILPLPLDGRSVELIGMLTDTPFFYHSISYPLTLPVHRSHHLSTLPHLSLSLSPLPISAVHLPIGGHQNAPMPAGRRHGPSLCTKTTGARSLSGSHLKKHKPYFAAPAKTPNVLAGTPLSPPHGLLNIRTSTLPCVWKIPDALFENETLTKCESI